MKQTSFFLITGQFLVLAFLVGLFSCQDIKTSQQPVTAQPANPCDTLSTLLPDQCIIYLEDPGKPIQPVINRMKTLSGIAIELIDSCLCGLYLAQGPGLDTFTRRHGATDEPELNENNGVFIGSNFELAFGPDDAPFALDTPRMIKYEQGTPGTSLYKKKPVKIAIIDSGFDPGAGKKGLGGTGLSKWSWTNREEIANQEDDDRNCLIDDIKGVDIPARNALHEIESHHGTAVAAVLTGYPGFDYPADIHPEFMNIRITAPRNGESTKTTLFHALCGIKYAMQKKADIAIASWGYYDSIPDPALAALLRQAGDQKMLIIAAAGNDSVDIDVCPCYPASFAGMDDFTHIWTVAAMDQQGKTLADFSNFGKRSVLFAAPGEKVRVFIPGNQEALLDGTSFAAPYVARAAAILKARHPDYGPAYYRNCLETLLPQTPLDLPVRLGPVNVPADWNTNGCLFE